MTRKKKHVMNKKFMKQIEYDIYEKSNERFLNCDAKMFLLYARLLWD